MPHEKLNYEKLGDFSDVDLSIRPHKIVYEEPEAVSTESPESKVQEIFRDVQNYENEENPEEEADKNELAEAHLEEARKANAHMPKMAVNPLLWQLHSKKKEGGVVQKGQLLDKHRYLMMENTSEPIPKVSLTY